MQGISALLPDGYIKTMDIHDFSSQYFSLLLFQSFSADFTMMTGWK